MKRLSLGVLCAVVLSAVAESPISVVSAQSSVQACMNPNSGEIKVLVKNGCNPGWVALTLSTGGSGDGRGARVVDADGDDVGAFMGDGQVLLHVSPYWLQVNMTENGFRLTGQGPLYPVPDCAGTDVYLEAVDGQLARWAGLRPDGLLHFAGNPLQPLIMQSIHFLNADGSLGACHNFSSPGYAGFFGPETSVPVPAGLSAPYHIVDP